MLDWFYLMPANQGNKSFIAFSNLGDTDSLTKTWKVCTSSCTMLYYMYTKYHYRSAPR